MKNMMKLLAALMAVMMMVLVVPAAFAEDAQPTEQPEVQAPAEEAKPEETAQPEATAEPTAEPTVEATTEPTVEPTVEATAEPTVEPTVEATVEPTVEPTVEAQPEATPAPEATVAPERSVKVLGGDESLQVGDTMTLTAKLSGFDGVEYSLTWQVKAAGGDWQDIAGEHDAALKVNLDDSSIGASWRVVVEIAD